MERDGFARDALERTETDGSIVLEIVGAKLPCILAHDAAPRYGVRSI